MRGQAVAKDGTVIDDSDTDALWLYDAYEDKFVEKVYENPDYDVGGIAISEKTEKPRLCKRRMPNIQESSIAGIIM